jgi:hypothetical protein
VLVKHAIVVSVIVATASFGQISSVRANGKEMGITQQLDPKISFVTSGGIWKSDKAYGHFRVIALTSGREESGSELYAQ